MTGVKPTNQLHLGNYFGIIPTIKNLQKDSNNEIFLGSMDLHALTTESNVREDNQVIIKFFMATLDCTNINLYVQSHYKQLTYLMWIFSCCTPVGYLNKMTQFKDKSINKGEMVNSGLFNYPLLMAADILCFDAHKIPVGIDQKQHVELARDIANFAKKKFNIDFVLPECIFPEIPKIYDLQNGGKMSKSSENINGALFFGDSEDILHKKITKAVTDNELMPENMSIIENSRPFVYNLCNIYILITGKTREEFNGEFAGKQMSIFKKSLSDAVISFMTPITNKMNSITSEEIDYTLKNNTIKDIYDKKILEIKSKIF